MGMVIGIRNYDEKNVQLTEEQKALQSSFDFGMLCICAGIGNITPDGGEAPKWGANITVDEALRRLNLVNRTVCTLLVDPDTGKPVDLDREFIAELARAGWEFNENNKSEVWFTDEMQRRTICDINHELHNAGYDNVRPASEFDHDKRQRLDSIAQMHADVLMGDTRYVFDSISELFDEFSEEVMRTNPQMRFGSPDGRGVRYLVWDEGAYEWKISETPQEEE